MQRKLTLKHLKAIRMLASGKSETEVTQALKLRRETLWRWKQIPEFNLELDRILWEMRDGMRQRLLNLADASITTIEKQYKTGFGSDPKLIHMALNVLKLLGAERILTENAPICGDISVERIEPALTPAPLSLPTIRTL